jgi:hypothetical protein
MTGSDERLFFWLGVVSEPARVTVRHRRETRHPRRDATQVRRTCVACVVMVCAVDGGRGSGQRLARHTPKKPNMLTRLNPRENSIDRHAPVVCHQKRRHAHDGERGVALAGRDARLYTLGMLGRITEEVHREARELETCVRACRSSSRSQKRRFVRVLRLERREAVAVEATREECCRVCENRKLTRSPTRHALRTTVSAVEFGDFGRPRGT